MKRIFTLVSFLCISVSYGLNAVAKEYSYTLCDISQDIQSRDMYNPVSIGVTVLIIFLAVYLMLKYYYKQW